MRFKFLFLLLISYTAYTQDYRVEYETVISHRPENNGKDINVRFKVIYDAFFGEATIKAMAKVESTGDYVYYNGTRYSREEIGEEIFQKIETGNIDVSFDIYQGSHKVTTVHVTELIGFDVAASPAWDDLWPGVSGERAKQIYKEGYQIRNARVTDANFSGFYALESFLKKKENYEEALNQATASTSTKEKIDHLETAKRYAPSEKQINEIDSQIETLEEQLKIEEQEKIKNELISKADQTDDKEEKIAFLEEAKQHTDSQSEKEEINRTVQKLKEEIEQEAQEKEKELAEKESQDEEETDEEESSNFSNSQESSEEEEEEGAYSYDSEESTEKSEEEKIAEQQKKKEEARQREEERRRRYMARKQAQNERNQQLAYSSAAASASFFYLLGGFIYSDYGKSKPNQLYRGSNLFFNMDIGFSLSTHPLYFASEKENYNYEITESTDSKNTITADLNLGLMVGYETDYIGGYALGEVTGGISPIFDSFLLSYGYGARIYGGFKNLKLFGEYQLGNRNISTSNVLDSQEYGRGKTDYSFANVKTGIKISWYGSPTAPGRNHIYLGLIEEKITRSLGRIQNIPIEESHFFKNAATYRGYLLEWRHDHHGILTITVFPKYPLTGITGGGSSDVENDDGGLYFQVGFYRSLTAFFN